MRIKFDILKVKMLFFILKLFLSLLSGILLIFAFPPFNLSGMAFIGLVPLLIVLKLEQGRLKNFIFSFLTGVIFFGGLLYWIAGIKLYLVPAWMLSIGWLLIILTLGSYIGFFGLIVKFLDNKIRLFKVLLAPLVWVAIEFIRSFFPFGGFPWGILGYSQYQNLMLIQIADKTGVFGISFLILLVNSAVAVVLLQLQRLTEVKTQRLKSQKPIFSHQYIRIPFALPFCLLVIVGYYIYGFMVMQKGLSVPDLKVAIIQSNIGIEKSWDWSINQEKILQGLIRLTRKAKNQQPSLVIWTETAILDSPHLLTSLRERLSSLAKEMRTYLLVGAPHIEFKNTKTEYYNSAFLFSNSGKIIELYDKIHLVPYGEMLPLEGILPIMRKILPQAGYYSPGKKLTVFQKPARFNVLICYEGIFGDLTRRFVKNGAEFIVNITNDAWSRTEGSYYQHFTMDIFRAVENKRYFLRAGNTGISAIITPYGEVKEILDIGKEGVIISNISPMNKRTFYTKFGDIFAFSCLILCGVLIFVGSGQKIG
ncbi:MAG: apolipoprotein N-acyltransferase [bacterium]